MEKKKFPDPALTVAILAIVVALLAVAAATPLNQAKSNIASYFTGIEIGTTALLLVGVFMLIVPSIYIVWRWFAWRDELIPLNEAGRWIYRKGGGALRDACRQFQNPFGISGYGEMWIKHVAEEENLPIYGRREIGLDFEQLEPTLWRITGYEPERPPVDISIRRRELWHLRRRGLKLENQIRGRRRMDSEASDP